jgi:hypothetical protein
MKPPKENIRFSVVGSLLYWWERLDYSIPDGWELSVFDNPAFISSLGEQCACVTGTIDNRTLKAADCVRVVRAKPATVDNQSFARYLLDVA